MYEHSNKNDISTTGKLKDTIELSKYGNWHFNQRIYRYQQSFSILDENRNSSIPPK